MTPDIASRRDARRCCVQKPSFSVVARNAPPDRRRYASTAGACKSSRDKPLRSKLPASLSSSFASNVSSIALNPSEATLRACAFPATDDIVFVFFRGHGSVGDCYWASSYRLSLRILRAVQPVRQNILGQSRPCSDAGALAPGCVRCVRQSFLHPSHGTCD
jgi:hypothetical protein